MGKPTICIGENKGADQLRGHREADQRLCFHYSDSTIPLLQCFNPKFQASSSFLCLYRPVCVRPVRKPHCWFSHEAAHILIISREPDTQLSTSPKLYPSYIPWITTSSSKSMRNSYHTCLTSGFFMMIVSSTVAGQCRPCVARLLRASKNTGLK